ncbi:peptidyl-prolyl cis-trans isomerase [Thalassotalea agarivorans]|uniref:PPIC-type PPIASE domain-containing protein n=1 Tax=Thalassotalea agarivorans TaxID=349064 RepID=A0A1I0E4Z6_THASX|nr:peptidylprolyl isomerase [Thalassotalea agarivorans]SET40041.1 PPIC-type PPIASE domain-containing protein [Thalassotalea agarivorans]
MTHQLSALLREPLLHFLLIGALIFVFVTEDDGSDNQVITISEGRIAQLKNDYVLRWQREPIQQELDNAINFYATTQMYLNEARSLGLDYNDSVIDRRLRQKMNFILEDIVAIQQPSEQDLQRFYQENPDSFLSDAEISFEQVHISIDKPDELLAQQIDIQKQRIAQGNTPEGDAFYVQPNFTAQSDVEIDKAFGTGFAAQLADAPRDQWSGPYRSQIGEHFVFVSGYELGTVKPYEEVKAAVEDGWRYQQFLAAEAAFEAKMKQHYRVELPEGYGNE